MARPKNNRGGPAKGSWSKQVHIIELGKHLPGDDNENDKTATPYRLPKISQSFGSLRESQKFRGRLMPDSDDNLWNRFAYEEHARISTLKPVVWKLMLPSTGQSTYQHCCSLAVPTFRTAMIAPSPSPVPRSEYMNDKASYERFLTERVRHEQTDLSMPVSQIMGVPAEMRAPSPTKSVCSVHWALGAASHAHFDKKGRSRASGPYSREFSITCGAPVNWLRMKLGKKRSSVEV